MEWHADLDRNSWIEIEFGFEIQIEIAFAVARKHRKGVESNDLHFATTFSPQIWNAGRAFLWVK